MQILPVRPIQLSTVGRVGFPQSIPYVPSNYTNPTCLSYPIVDCGMGRISSQSHMSHPTMQMLPVHPIQLSTVGRVGFPQSIPYVPSDYANPTCLFYAIIHCKTGEISIVAKSHMSHT